MKYKLNEFYNEDCLEAMKEFPDGYFELAIADPPYGIFADKKSSHFAWKNGTGGTWASKYGDKTTKWDYAPEPEYFEELKRISQNQIIWGANHFGVKSNNYVIWRKLTISETFTMGMCEFASVSLKGNPKVFEFQPQDPDRFHPTQKPVTLYKWLLENYAKPGDKILDTHVGSASSLIACYQMGYDYIGFEIDKEYYEKASKRLELAKAQKVMF